MDNELIFWIVAGIASLVFLVAIYIEGKRDRRNYIEWMRDWEEYK